MKPSLSLPRGIYCPSITFFQPNEAQDLNLEFQEEHTRYLISSGIQGIVLHGTTGESVLLSHDERNAITALVSKLRAEMSAEKRFKVIVGCSAQSAREVVSMCKDAKRCGGDAVLVLPPSYWAKETTVEVLADFYAEVADSSPLPLIIYSYPSITNNIDLDSDLLSDLAQHPNIIGVKLTCANPGKLTRLTSLSERWNFTVLAGSTEWLSPAMSSGAIGAITGLANAYPRCCLRLFNLLEEGIKTEEIKGLQARISNVEYGMGGRGLAGVKWAVGVARRYEEAQKMDNETSLLAPRRPLRQLRLEGKQWINERVFELHGLEAELKRAESWSGKGETNGTREVNGGS